MSWWDWFTLPARLAAAVLISLGTVVLCLLVAAGALVLGVLLALWLAGRDVARVERDEHHHGRSPMG